METYTTRQVAEITGKTLQAISRYAQKHEDIGRKIGRDWFFSESDLAQFLAVKRHGPGRPRGSGKGKAVQP